MELKEIMEQKTFAVLGNTLNSEKYAYKIKEGLLKNGYEVFSVGSELESLNDIAEEVDIIDLCIHPVKGLKLLQESKKVPKCVVIQPGAESEDIKNLLKEKNISFIEGCLLIGMSLYCKHKPEIHKE